MAAYDYLIVGCGMFGAVFGQRMSECGRRVLIVEKRDHIGGNCSTETVEAIHVHQYGPHIFHTNHRRVWEYVNRFADFNHFVNRPRVRYQDKVYSFPINLMTLHQLWGVKTPAEAKAKLRQVAVRNDDPANLEEWALSQVGEEIYRVFIEGYTAKQWGKKPCDLPASILGRVPIRLNFNDNYYDDTFQGIPIGGYTAMFERMLDGIEVRLDTDYFADREYWDSRAAMVVYTGKLDEYFNYECGRLEYRGLRFETEVLDGDYQGTAVMNYTEGHIPYTRTIEHKHFDFRGQPRTVVTWEFPSESEGIPCYPVNTETNNQMCERYRAEAEKQNDLVLGGRLATYRYLDMDDVVLSAIKTADRLLPVEG